MPRFLERLLGYLSLAIYGVGSFVFLFGMALFVKGLSFTASAQSQEPMRDYLSNCAFALYAIGYGFVVYRWYVSLPLIAIVAFDLHKRFQRKARSFPEKEGGSV